MHHSKQLGFALEGGSVEKEPVPPSAKPGHCHAEAFPREEKSLGACNLGRHVSGTFVGDPALAPRDNRTSTALSGPSERPRQTLPPRMGPSRTACTIAERVEVGTPQALRKSSTLREGLVASRDRIDRARLHTEDMTLGSTSGSHTYQQRPSESPQGVDWKKICHTALYCGFSYRGVGSRACIAEHGARGPIHPCTPRKEPRRLPTTTAAETATMSCRRVLEPHRPTPLQTSIYSWYTCEQQLWFLRMSATQATGSSKSA